MYFKGTTKFFNEDIVKAKLHANPTKVGPWSMCFPINYKRGDAGSIGLYQSLMDAGLKIWHYSGNADAAVPTIAT